MARIPEETIQRVIEANDIVDVITSYVPDLKRAGTSYKACCPFHMEKSPSFNVNSGRQFFKCFGCGEAGNVLGFVIKMENLPFVDAVRKLAARVNIPIIEEAETAAQVAERKSISRIKELHNDFAQFMHTQLMKNPEAQHARDYLKSRGFSSDMAQRWLIGWHPVSPAPVIEWAKSKGYKARELVTAGLASSNDNPRQGLYYRFRDRLMFSIHNDYGDVVAFSGRQLREDPRSGKYINSPETPIFKKSKVFFGLDKARKHIPKSGYALICEGQIDVIACHEGGFPFAIATQGTACTAEHAAILRRYCKTVLLCYDSDSSGQASTAKAFTHLTKLGLLVKVVSLPEGEDPDSLIKKSGAGAFESLLNNAREFFDYKVRYESTQRDLTDGSEKAQLAAEMSELLASMSDNFQLTAALSFLSTRLGMSENDLRIASRRQKKRDQRVQERQDALSERERRETVVPPLPVHNAIATLCHMGMNFPEVYDWMQEQIEPLFNAMEGLEGASLLKLILTKSPRPESSATVTAFLETLPSPVKESLTPLYGYLDPQRTIATVSDSPLTDVKSTFNILSIASLERKRKGLTARIADPTLTLEEQSALQLEVEEIRLIITDFKKWKATE